MGFSVYDKELSLLDLDDKAIVNTLNPHSYVMAKYDELFLKALQSSTILLPDGVGIVWAAFFLHGKKINKIAGYDIHLYLLKKINKEGGKVFYLGSSKRTLDKIKERIENEYSNIHFSSYSPPYKEEFSEIDNEIILEKINSFNPDVLFLGMTAPKQEKWLYKNKNLLNYKIASCIGAVFDFYAGTVERPSLFWVNIHLEWLVRLLKEPKRLWKRNMISSPLFVFYVISNKLSKY